MSAVRRVTKRTGSVYTLIVNRIPGRHFVRNLIEQRSLVVQLVRRDFRQRYVGSAAGWIWGVVHPLVLLLSWTFIFQVCLKVKLPPGALTQNYVMYLFCGMLPWLLFQETVLRSAPSMVEQANLITRTVFPAEVLPVSIFLSSLIHHLIALALVVVASVVVLGSVSPMILLLPLYMVFVGLLAVGVGWFVASLHVYLRDTAQVLAVVMTLWFWFTPIMILEQQIPPRLRWLIQLNPMSWLVRAYRERLLSAHWPAAQEIAVLAAYSVIVFVAGGLFFRHLKRGFADVL
jgi:lipopolysaccharide transport system permease protein